MMKRFLIFFSLLFSAFCTEAQDSLKILNGPVEWEQLKEYRWFNENSQSYKPDLNLRAELNQLLLREGIEIVIYGGTWCSDTQYLLPQVYSVFDAEVRKKVRMIMVGRDKQGQDTDKWKIAAVPVILILKNGLEAGRITETVQVSPEADLLKILKGVK